MPFYAGWNRFWKLKDFVDTKLAWNISLEKEVLKNQRERHTQEKEKFIILYSQISGSKFFIDKNFMKIKSWWVPFGVVEIK